MLRRYHDSVEDLLSAPASNLIDQLRSYLTDSLYFEVRSATIESLFTKRLAECLVGNQINLNELLTWNDGELDGRFEECVGDDWWPDVVHGQHAEICRSKVQSYRHYADRYVGHDTLRLEKKIAGLEKRSDRYLTRYPSARGFVVLCKNSFNPADRVAAMDVIISVGKQPKTITPITEAIHRLELMRRDRGPRLRVRIKRILSEDLLAYLANASVHSDHSLNSRVFALGFKNLPPKKKAKLGRVLRWDYFYPSTDVEPSEPDYWEQFFTTLQAPSFLRRREKWIGEILRSASKDPKANVSEIIECAAWVKECGHFQESQIAWVLPNVVVETDAGPNQIDVCSISVENKVTCIRFIECTKSDSEEKAVDDLKKLEKIRSRLRNFDDLVVKQVVYGASSVRDHFSSTQMLLASYRIRA